MKFCWTTLHVKSIDASIAFYNGLVGLPVKQRMSPRPGVELAFLGDGETTLELLCDGHAPDHSLEGAAKTLQTISIGFILDRPLQDMQDQLRAAGTTDVSDIHSPGPGISFFYVSDPDGFKVQFVAGSL